MLKCLCHVWQRGCRIRVPAIGSTRHPRIRLSSLSGPLPWSAVSEARLYWQPYSKARPDRCSLEADRMPPRSLNSRGADGSSYLEGQSTTSRAFHRAVRAASIASFSWVQGGTANGSSLSRCRISPTSRKMPSRASWKARSIVVVPAIMWWLLRWLACLNSTGPHADAGPLHLSRR